ncbi:MAG: hypothetical protein JJU20_14990 [Opitutales bacterium]|nr:hypothetical protein [Opitutales bacterium]
MRFLSLPGLFILMFAKKNILWLTIILFINTPIWLCALQFRVFDPDRHVRLAGQDLNEGFIFHYYDPSGISVSQDTLSGAGRATLISRQHFVTTTHTQNTHPRVVTFVGSDGVERDYDVLDYEVVPGSTDLTLGRLAHPIPENVPIQPLAVVQGSAIGLSAANVGVFGMNNRAGINRMESGGEFSELLGFNFDAADDSLFGRGRDEAVPVMGDSGHALVAAYKGRLFALGVHFTVTSSQSLHRHLDFLNERIKDDGCSIEIWDQLPRQIADFHPAVSGRIWHDSGINGGRLPIPQEGQDKGVGRIQSSLSHHHLIATSDSTRPFWRSDEGFPYLAFEGNSALVTTYANLGSYRGFPFELNTEQPRVTMIIRLPEEELGIRSIAKFSYTLPSGSEMTLLYDHGENELISRWNDNEVRVSAPEDEWMIVEWFRQRERISLSVNGTRETSLWIDSKYNSDTQFLRLRIGRNATCEGVSSFHLARLTIEDSGRARNHNFFGKLYQEYIEPLESTALSFVEGDIGFKLFLESSSSAGEMFYRIHLWPERLTVSGGSIFLKLDTISNAEDLWRINGGQALVLESGVENLRIDLQMSRGSFGEWYTVDLAEIEYSVEVHLGGIRIRVPPPSDLMEDIWYRAVLRPSY